MFYVYILYSERAMKYYVGYTDNIQRRLIEHNELSLNSFTSKFRPWKLKAQFYVGENRGVAMQIEKHIKRQKSKKYIEELIARQSIQVLIERYGSNG